MSNTEEILFSLLGIYVGKDADIPFMTDSGWEEVFELAKKQSLAGVVFSAMEKLPGDKWPGKAVSVRFFSQAKAIREYNAILDKSVAKLADVLKTKYGIDGVLLKGQGAAMMYPDNFSRNPGDIDFWCYAPKAEVISFARSKQPGAKVFYHHVDAGKIGNIPIELHFTPTWLNSPFNNRRLQNFFRASFPSQLQNRVDVEGVPVAVPTDSFNLVFMPVHIYRHLFAEGVGLRQLMDLYFLLKHSSAEDRAAAAEVLRSLGMRRFIGALMWVMGRVFGMDGSLSICPANARDGEFLLREIMISGNFGCSDTRTSSGPVGKMVRLLRFLISYPSEVLWSPVFKLWQIVFVRLRYNR